MGSVHYTSPEQARGGYSDEKSDIYSLGITMFEMLTGRVPFNGETTVAIAIKHIQEELPSPRDYVPEIPISVEHIVCKCCQKSPDRRYQSMAELIVDLKQSLINPDEDFVKLIDPDEEEDYDPRMEKVTTILAVVAALLIGGILIFFVGRTLGVFQGGTEDADTPQESVEQVEMIRVVGMDVDEAKRALLELGLTPEIQYEVSTAYKEGTVLRASIQVGIMVDKDSNVILTVAQETEGITVPSVTGKSKEEATSILEKEGFVVNAVESYDASIESGYVISQSPEAQTTAPEGSSIIIRVSQGSEDNKVRVPNVIGMTEMDGTAVLTESGLIVGTVTEEENDDPALADKICYQSYSMGSYVDKGTTIDIRISIGPSQGTYRYSEGITAPTEDADYQGGMLVTVVVTTQDGTQLLNTQTASFPVAVNYTGIRSPNGVITFTFTVEKPETTTTDPETGETVTIPGTSETKTVHRPVNFVEE